MGDFIFGQKDQVKVDSGNELFIEYELKLGVFE